MTSPIGSFLKANHCRYVVKTKASADKRCLGDINIDRPLRQRAIEDLNVPILILNRSIIICTYRRNLAFMSEGNLV